MRPSEQSAPRVVLDTQLLLRGAVARTESLTARIYDAWRNGWFTLLLSDPILAEIEAVLSRPEVLQKHPLAPVMFGMDPIPRPRKSPRRSTTSSSSLTPLPPFPVTVFLLCAPSEKLSFR